MLNRYASTTTLKTKQGIAPISIVEFFSKDARNEFLDMLRKDMLVCHGQIAVGRAQIPKYQREADQPPDTNLHGSSQHYGTPGSGCSSQNPTRRIAQTSRSTSSSPRRSCSPHTSRKHGHNGGGLLLPTALC